MLEYLSRMRNSEDERKIEPMPFPQRLNNQNQDKKSDLKMRVRDMERIKGEDEERSTYDEGDQIGEEHTHVNGKFEDEHKKGIRNRPNRKPL